MFVRIVFALSLGIPVGIGAGACSGSGVPDLPPTATHARAPVSARPRDLNAAISRALTRTELAVTQRSEPEPGTLVYELVDLRGREGTLIVRTGVDTRADPAERAEPAPFRLSASIGRFGDPDLERRLIEAVSRELAALARAD